MQLPSGAREVDNQISSAPDPSKVVGEQARAAFDGLGRGFKEASESRTREMVAKQGHVAFRNPAAAEAFRQNYPSWEETRVGGETRFSPPTVSPPTVSPPTVSPPTVSPPTVSPPTVSPPTVSPPTVSPPTVSPPTVSPPTVSPPTSAPDGRHRVKPTQNRSHYEVLGVAPDASQQEIKTAFRQQARDNHPDQFAHGPQQEAASARMASANAAFTVTGHEEKRAEYDEVMRLQKLIHGLLQNERENAKRVYREEVKKGAAPLQAQREALRGVDLLRQMRGMAPDAQTKAKQVFDEQRGRGASLLESVEAALAGKISTPPVKQAENPASPAPQNSTPSVSESPVSEPSVPQPPAPPMPPTGGNGSGTGGGGGGGSRPPGSPPPPPGSPPPPPASPPPGSPRPNGKTPVVRAVRPLAAKIGDPIRISGAHLSQISSVSVGGVTTPLLTRDDYLIVVKVPQSVADGVAKVELTWSGGIVQAPGTLTIDSAAGNPGAPNNGNGGGFWQTVLGDKDVQNAANQLAPGSLKQFVTPAMNRLAGVVGGPAMSPRMAANVGVGLAGVGGFAAGRAAGTSGILGGAGGMIGQVAGGPLGAAIGAAVGTVVEKGFQAAVGNVREMRSLGAKSVDNLTRGALSLTDKAFGVGLEIGDTLLRAALRPFGVTGAAMAGFAGTVARSLAGVLQSGLSLASKGLSLAGGLAAGGAGLLMGGLAAGGAGRLMGGLGAYLGSVIMGPIGGLGAYLGPVIMGPIGGVLGLIVATAVGKALMQVVNVVTGVIGGVFDQLGKALGELGKIGGAALKGLLEVLDDVRQSAMNLSKSILDISQQSGLSVGASAVAVNNLQGFGVSPQQTAQMFGQNVLYTQAMDRAYGIQGDSGSAQNLRDTRETYQRMLAQGNGNPLMANMMMQQTNKAALIPMANLPTANFERSLANGAGLQMGEGAVLEWQQNFGLMQNDLGRFAEYVKVTLGNAFLPSMSRGLGMAVDYFKANKDEIIAGIKSIGRWFYAELPGLVIQGAILVVTGFTFITKGLANMIRGFSDSRGPLHEFVFNFLSGVDRIIHGLRTMIAVGAAAAASIIAPFGTKTIAADAAYRYTMNATKGMDTNFAGQFQQATARQFDAQGRPVRTAWDDATDALDGAGKKGDSFITTLQGYKQQYDPQMLGANRMFDSLESIDRKMDRKPDIKSEITVNISPQEEFLAKVLSYETWTTWQALGQAGS